MKAFPWIFAISVGAIASLVGCSGCKEGGGGEAPAPADAAAHPRDAGPVNALAIPASAVAREVNPGNLPVYDGPTGSIEGTITISGDPAPDVPGLDFSLCPEGVATYGKLFREGPPLPDGSRPLADALVVVTDYNGFVPETVEAKLVEIDHCALPTRTITLTFGQRLDIANKSKTLVSPMFEEAPTPAMIIVPPEGKGDPVHLYPPHAGHFTLTDRLGSYLRTDVWAFRHPFHTVSTLDGHYRIDGIPVGRAKVGSRLTAINQNVTKTVEILAGVVQKVDLSFTYTKADAGQVDLKPKELGPRVILH